MSAQANGLGSRPHNEPKPQRGGPNSRRLESPQMNEFFPSDERGQQTYWSIRVTPLGFGVISVATTQAVGLG